MIEDSSFVSSDYGSLLVLIMGSLISLVLLKILKKDVGTLKTDKVILIHIVKLIQKLWKFESMMAKTIMSLIFYQIKF